MAGPLMAANKFQIKAGQETFDLDVRGQVFQGGQSVGTWKTNADNKLVISRDDKPAVIADAAWKFNANNQLVLTSGGADLFNFQQDANLKPMFETRNCVLRFTPDKLHPFVFELRGEWDLTKDHDLRFTPVNGEACLIEGFVNSPEGKFIFFFNDKTRPLLKHKLGFVGDWENARDPQGRAKEGQLVFRFRRENGSADEFELPGKITVNRTTNQLRYEYKKGGTQAIDFVGTLIISEDFTVTYQLTKRFSNSGEVMVGETTLAFGAMFRRDKFSGNLELVLKKADGAAGTTRLTITGDFTAVLGPTRLLAGFRFDQIREGQKITTTFGFAGQLEFSAGTVRWAFTTSNAATRTIDLTIGADITLGAIKADARLNLQTAGGQVQGIEFLLGVSF